MRITQSTVERLAAEITRVSGYAPVESISHPGDGRTHYVMAESRTSTYYGARQAAAYLLGMLAGFDPAGKVRHIETRPQWVADIDDEYEFGNIPAKQLAARWAGTHYGETLRERNTGEDGAKADGRVSAATVAADAANRIGQHRYVTGTSAVGTDSAGRAVFTVTLRNSQRIRFTAEAAD
jgi:hypothetical protein